MSMGLLSAALGGMADVGLKQIDDERQAERETRLAEFNSKLIQQRTEALDTMRRNRESEVLESKQRRLAEQAETIHTEATERRTNRELETATKRAPSVDGPVMDFLKSTLPPEKVKAVYGVEPETPVSRLDDEIAVARKNGFSESENGLRADRRGAMAQLDSDRREDDRAKRTVLIEKRIDDSRIASDKRIERMGQGGGARTEPSFVATYKYLESKGYSRERIEEILTQKKAMSPAELAAKLAGKDKPASGSKEPRKSLEGEGSYMDDAGDIRKTGGELVKRASPLVRADAQQDSKGNPRTYDDKQPTVEEFNKRMADEAAAKQAEQDAGLLNRLRRSFSNEPEKRK